MNFIVFFFGIGSWKCMTRILLVQEKHEMKRCDNFYFWHVISTLARITLKSMSNFMVSSISCKSRMYKVELGLIVSIWTFTYRNYFGIRTKMDTWMLNSVSIYITSIIFFLLAKSFIGYVNSNFNYSMS